jgi:hypothetical protein
MRRRSFLGLTIGAGALVTLPSRSVLSADQTAMVLQLARAGAVFPIDFPSFGEPGPAWARATTSRLRAAVGKASPARLRQVTAGADALIGRGLLHQRQTVLLDGAAELADTPANDLTAVVALAIATVSRHFDPESDDAAELWLDCLRELHQQGWSAGEVS